MKNNELPALTQEYLGIKYDNAEFTLATGITDYDVRANVADAFVNHEKYTTINFRTTETITVRFNSTSYPEITINSSRPFELDNLIEINEIYITNASGATASIKIFGTRKGEGA